MYTQQDVLKQISELVAQYEYYSVVSLDTSCICTYIAKLISGNIVGCVGIEKNIIKHLRIKDTFRRFGIGTFLLHEAENTIKKRKYSSSIAYVHCNNAIALSFFKKHKYYPVYCGEYYYALYKELSE